MRKLSRILGVVAVVQLLAGCTGPSGPVAAPPQAPGPAAEAPPDTAPTPQQSPVAPPAAVQAPRACLPFAEHPQGCRADAPALELLAKALQPSEPNTNQGVEAALARDQALAALQTCDAFSPGVVLTLRAELAPPECGDVVVGESLPPGVDPELSETLTALVHAAHLNRLVTQAPRLEPPFSKQQFAEFSKTVLEKWVVTQAQAVYEVAKSGSKLRGYARGVVAVEAGLADMRFVSVVRAVPLPEELSQDPELRDTYYAELDVALGPWKERGRDAALVGLKELAAVGVLNHPRVTRARALLSELYGGRRIDRLDGLILPAPPAVASDVAQGLASLLPTPLVPYVLPDLDATQPTVLALLLQNGLPPAVRADLESRSLSPETNFTLAWGLVRFGQTYWSSAEFMAALSVLGRGPWPATPEAELLRAVALALKVGPRDATEMMARGSAPVSASSVAPLDTLAKGPGPWAAAAAFDAAYILELWPPAGDPAFWQTLAQRYTRAQPRLSDRADQARAKDLANAARATAKSLLPAPRGAATP